MKEINLKAMNKKEVESYLGTDKDIMSDDFWQSDENTIFYMDSSLSTILSEVNDYLKDLKDTGVSADIATIENQFELIYLTDTGVDSYIAIILND